MKAALSKITLTAGIMLVIAFTLTACSNDGNNAEKYDYCLLAEQKECLVGPFELSTCNGQLSNSCPSDYDTGSQPSSSSGSAGLPSSGSGIENYSAVFAKKGKAASKKKNPFLYPRKFR